MTIGTRIVDLDAQTKNLESALGGKVADLRVEAPASRDDDLKIWIMVRKDLPILAEKLAGQTGHAAGTVMVIADRKDRELVDRYLAVGQPKICVTVKNAGALEEAVEIAKEAGIPACSVLDSGRTVFDGPTLTVGAFGPCLRGHLPKKLSRLQLFKGWANDTPELNPKQV